METISRFGKDIVNRSRNDKIETKSKGDEMLPLPLTPKNKIPLKALPLSPSSDLSYYSSEGPIYENLE